jgi:hypothetical protein
MVLGCQRFFCFVINFDAREVNTKQREDNRKAGNSCQTHIQFYALNQQREHARERRKTVKHQDRVFFRHAKRDKPVRRMIAPTT